MRDPLKEQMLIDVLLRITALENLLIAKNIVTDAEIQNEIDRISSMISTAAMKQAQDLNPGGPDLDEWVKEILSPKKDDDSN